MSEGETEINIQTDVVAKPEDSVFVTAINLQKQDGPNLATSWSISHSTGNPMWRKHYIGSAFESALKANPGFKIADYRTIEIKRQRESSFALFWGGFIPGFFSFPIAGLTVAFVVTTIGRWLA